MADSSTSNYSLCNKTNKHSSSLLFIWLASIIFSEFYPSYSFQGWESVWIFNLASQLQRCKITSNFSKQIRHPFFFFPHETMRGNLLISNQLSREEWCILTYTILKLFLPKDCLKWPRVPEVLGARIRISYFLGTDYEALFRNKRRECKQLLTSSRRGGKQHSILKWLKHDATHPTLPCWGPCLHLAAPGHSRSSGGLRGIWKVR